MARTKNKVVKPRRPPQKRRSSTNVDFISDLMDSLLLHILSFLPTKAAVATSILSRRWRDLWKGLQVLNIVNNPVRDPASDRASGEYIDESKEHFLKFDSFVNNVLAQVQHVKKFRLSCQVVDEDAVDSWISSVNGPHLQEMHLKIFCREYPEKYFPCDIFDSTSLVSLFLERDVSLFDLEYVDLPSLKNLKLHVNYVDLDIFLSGCPILETLEVVFRECLAGDEIEAIHLPHSLKRFTFADGSYAERIDYLEIDAPSLEYLNIILEGRYLTISVSDFPNMVEAHLDFHHSNAGAPWVPVFLNALCKTRSLVLSNSVTESLICDPDLKFPDFSCLNRLKIDFRVVSSAFLLDLLDNCHRLQVLIVHNHGRRCRLIPNSYDPSSWKRATDDVPNCVISHLKTVEFIGYQDFAEEHDFLAYILQRGLVLKTMTIHTDIYCRFDRKKKKTFLKKLSNVPRVSSKCKIKID